MIKVIEIIAELVKFIAAAVKNGASNEEVMQRIAAPGGVGQKLIDAVRSTSTKIDDFVANG